MRRLTYSSAVFLGISLLVGSLATATAGTKKREKHVARFPAVDLAAYSVVYVEDFEVTDPKVAENPKREAKAQMASRGIPDFLVEVLKTDELYDEVLRGKAEPRPGAIAVTARITTYKPGSKVGRAMMAGAGRAKLDLEVVISETETGRQLVSFPVERTWAWGGAMGMSKGIEEMDENVATELAMYIARSKSGQQQDAVEEE